MRTVLADKIFYFKNIRHQGCFSHKKMDYLMPLSRINTITYDYETKVTRFNFKDNIINTDGNVVSQVVDILNRPHTNGIIIEEDGTIKEMF